MEADGHAVAALALLAERLEGLGDVVVELQAPVVDLPGRELLALELVAPAESMESKNYIVAISDKELILLITSIPTAIQNIYSVAASLFHNVHLKNR